VDAKWIHLAQDTKKAGNLLNRWAIISFSRRTCVCVCVCVCVCGHMQTSIQRAACAWRDKV